MENSKKILSEWKEKGGFKTYQELADYIGVSFKTLDTWKNRGSIPAKYILQYQHLQQDKTQNSPSTSTISVRYYPDIHASAGYGLAPLECEYEIIELEHSLLKDTKILNKHNLDILRVEGDSMLPYIRSGERVIVEREVNPKNGDVVIAVIEDNLYIKRFLKHPLGHWVKLMSENEHYPDIELNGQEIERMKVVGIVRMVMRVI